MSDIAKRLRHYREAKGLSLRELGKLAHLSHSFIADIESGRSNPSLDTTITLARILNVSVAELTGESENSAHDSMPARREGLNYQGNAQKDNTASPQALAAEIERLRKAKGLSHKDLAKRAEISEAYLTSILKGEKPRPSPGALRRLADALGVNYAMFARLAGYIMKAGDAPESKNGLDAFWFRGEGLTEDDMADILAIIESKERRRKKFDAD